MASVGKTEKRQGMCTLHCVMGTIVYNDVLGTTVYVYTALLVLGTFKCVLHCP